MGTMTKRFLRLDDIRSMNDVDRVASVFGRLGYNPLQGSPEIAIEDLQLTPKSAESIWKTHLIADRSQGAESLQVLLFQLHPDELAIPSAIGNRMRSIAQSLCRRPSNFLLLGTTDYNQIAFVNPRKSFDQKMNLRVGVRKLLIDRHNPTAYDRDRLEAIAAHDLSPQQIYQRHCDAFDVEKLTKRFYEGYKELFEYVSKVLLAANSHPYFNDPIRLQQFVQRLLGRVMFLYFLQKKGFLNEDRDFLKTQYKQLAPDPEDHDFYTHVLEPLFFDILNKQRSNSSSQFGKIPYLNGGLFERDYGAGILDNIGLETPERVSLPNSLFDPTGDKGVLKFFNSYNFTVAENTPDNEDIAVDPEMLGKVFENLLESTERGKSGTFYTPRSIVHFMCVESLSRYLADETGLDIEFLKRLTEFDPTFPNFEVNELTKDQAKQLKQALASVRICDIAVGSGAFPMGMMQIVLSVKQAIACREGLSIRRGSLAMSEWKREIIANNLYGVDIKPEAVEIAKLRMWLSMVVDIPTIDDVEPLPNLDYKLMCGDSLISPIDSKLDVLNSKLDIPDRGKDRQIELAVTPVQVEIHKLAELQQDYFFAQSDSRTELKARIIAAETKIFQTSIAQNRQYWQSEERKLNLDIQIMKGKVSKPQKVKQQTITNRLTELKKLETAAARGLRSINFFQWKLHFSEVFRAKRGFDIVIGNPPYVRADVGGDNLALRQTIEASGDYETLWEKWDLYVACIERGYKLLKPNGITSMIVSDAYCHSKYAKKSQEWFLKNSRILRLDFLSKLQFFDAAVRNVIYFYQKSNGNKNIPSRFVHETSLGDIRILSTNRQEQLNCRAFFPEGEKISKFKNSTIPLESICYVSVGMVVNAHEKIAKGAFELCDLVSDTKDKIHSRAFVEGKHLSRWLPATNKWLEWGTERAPCLFRRPTFPELYEVKEKILAPRSPGSNPKACYDNQRLHFSESSVGFIPWHSLLGIRNNSIKKATRYSDEKPSRPDLPVREKLEEISGNFSIKFLLGIANSTAAHEFLKANRRSNIHIYPDDWKQLPIPNISIEKQQPIIELVDRILTIKLSDSSADISSVQAEINDRASHLYGLISKELKSSEGILK
jgi:adenine-specific DNA-methyltransferase